MTKTTFAQSQLRQLVERIERLEEEKRTIAADIKEVYLEAKANGFDAAIIRKIVGLRKMDPSEREEMQAMLDMYMVALGMQPDFFDPGEDQQQPQADPPHDPATGELTEPQPRDFGRPSLETEHTPSAAECLPGAAADVEQGPEEVSPLASGPDLYDMAAEMPFADDLEMPEFLKRRKAA